MDRRRDEDRSKILLRSKEDEGIGRKREIEDRHFQIKEKLLEGVSIVS